MRAFIVSIGSELLLGQLTDTNATYLAQELSATGIELVHVMHAGDDRERLAEAIRLGVSVADVVICSGGVGPTDDDLTREAISDIVEETPVIDEALLTDLRAFFQNRGQTMPERNAKQAWTIPSGEILPNPVGTAPGWIVRTKDDPPRLIVAMPGVPREMFRMWREQALPRIKGEADQQIIDSTIIKTIGIGESAAEDLLHDLVVRADPIVATYAKNDGVHVHVTALGSDREETRARRDRGVDEVSQRLAEYIWGRDAETIPKLIGNQLRFNDQKLGILERGLGSAASEMLASEHDVAAQIAGCLTYPCTIEAGDLDPEQTVIVDAAHARRLADATVGLALTFVTDRIENGVVFGTLYTALSESTGEPTIFPTARHRGSLTDIQRRCGLHAADLLRQWLAPSAPVGQTVP